MDAQEVGVRAGAPILQYIQRSHRRDSHGERRHVPAESTDDPGFGTCAFAGKQGIERIFSWSIARAECGNVF